MAERKYTDPDVITTGHLSDNFEIHENDDSDTVHFGILLGPSSDWIDLELSPEAALTLSARLNETAARRLVSRTT
jgi:hypothetical protein